MKPSASLPLDILHQFINYCNTITEPTVILVEGKRDIEALDMIGIKLINGKILARKGLPLTNIVDQIYPINMIILLLDFDKEGRHMYRELKKEIQKRTDHGFIDSYPRQLLYQFSRAARINEIEELKQFYPFTSKIEGKFNNASIHNLKDE